VRALCVRTARQNDAQTADFQAIDEAICEIEKRTEGLNEIETSAKTIQSGSEKILRRVELCRKALVQQVEILREKMQELKTLSGADDSAAV
jgi:dsDNA-specific endonuclease/ATPase MutS2